MPTVYLEHTNHFDRFNHWHHTNKETHNTRSESGWSLVDQGYLPCTQGSSARVFDICGDCVLIDRKYIHNSFPPNSQLKRDALHTTNFFLVVGLGL